MATITAAQLQPIATDLQNQVNALNQLIANAGGGATTGSPAGGSTAPGTTLTASSGGSITDVKGAVWTIGAPTNGGNYILKNGAVAYGDGVGTKLVIDTNGAVWAYTSGNVWYMDLGSGWGGATIVGPVT
jgi:hypothetical protein